MNGVILKICNIAAGVWAGIKAGFGFINDLTALGTHPCQYQPLPPLNPEDFPPMPANAQIAAECKGGVYCPFLGVDPVVEPELAARYREKVTQRFAALREVCITLELTDPQLKRIVKQVMHFRTVNCQATATGGSCVKA